MGAKMKLEFLSGGSQDKDLDEHLLYGKRVVVCMQG